MESPRSKPLSKPLTAKHWPSAPTTHSEAVHDSRNCYGGRLRGPSGQACLPARKSRGSDLSETPVCQARAVFGGVAPAPPVLRPSWPGRPARSANDMTDKALTRPRVLRTVPEQCCAPPRGCCAGVFSPQHDEPGVQTAGPQPLAGERIRPTPARSCVSEAQDNIHLSSIDRLLGCQFLFKLPRVLISRITSDIYYRFRLLLLRARSDKERVVLKGGSQGTSSLESCNWRSRSRSVRSGPNADVLSNGFESLSAMLRRAHNSAVH